MNSVFVECNLVSMFEIVLEFCAESLFILASMRLTDFKFYTQYSQYSMRLLSTCSFLAVFCIVFDEIDVFQKSIDC